MKQPAIYIMANFRNGSIYTGVTSNLPKRVWEHKERITKGFTANYNCKMLVYYELHETIEFTILREKQIKGGSRKKKLGLIESLNPQWQDLYESII